MAQPLGNRIHRTLMRLIFTGRLRLDRNIKLRGLDMDRQHLPRPLRRVVDIRTRIQNKINRWRSVKRAGCRVMDGMLTPVTR
jgi:hypothetical protein